MTAYFQQLEASLNALRAHYRARRDETTTLRSMLEVADGKASVWDKACQTVREDLRAGVAVSADSIIRAYRGAAGCHADADRIRARLEHAQALEGEAFDNMRSAADNLLAEVEAMVQLEMMRPETDDIGPVWESLEG